MNSGMIRRIDDLGRIVIPKEIRKNPAHTGWGASGNQCNGPEYHAYPLFTASGSEHSIGSVFKGNGKGIKNPEQRSAVPLPFSLTGMSVCIGTAAFLTKSAAGYSHSSNMNTIRKSLFIWKQPISVR